MQLASPARSPRSALDSLLALPLLLGSLAGCGSEGGSEDTPNNAPIAEATAPTEVLIGTSVTLDGTASMDPDEDLVSFLWSMVAAPEGSAAVLDDPSAAQPSFAPDMEGTYVLELVVTDGELESEPVEVSVTVTRDNTAPTADAGADQSALTGDVVTLDGSGSSDPDGDPLEYDWAFRSLPEESAATLRGAVGPNPSFTADLAGEYVVRLEVSDGRATSSADTMTVTVTPDNMAPIANAGPDVDVLLGDEAIFDGRASSDPDGDPLSYRWTLASKPEASVLTSIENPRGAQSRLVPDAPGTYVARLVVNDGELSSSPDDAIVTVAPPALAPEPPPAEEPPPPVQTDCAPEPGMIFCDALNGSTSSNRRDGGTFVDGGWKAPGQIIWDLGRTLTSGRFSATLLNWNPASDSPQHQGSKAHILNMYEMSHANVHSGGDDRSSWFNVRTGPVYRDMFKFYSSIAGFGDGNREETYHPPPNGRIDPSVPHTIEVVWGNREISIFVDGQRVGTHRHRTDMRLRYVVIGRDSSPSGDYSVQNDVIYRDIKVYENR